VNIITSTLKFICAIRRMFLELSNKKIVNRMHEKITIEKYIFTI